MSKTHQSILFWCVLDIAAVQHLILNLILMNGKIFIATFTFKNNNSVPHQ
jgi:hypothetical protein